MYRTRVFRRHQDDKAKKYTMDIARNVYHLSHSIDEEFEVKWVQRSHQNLKRCSCLMCGNPRRHLKGTLALTMQERRQLEEDDSYLYELEQYEEEQ